MKGRNSFTSTQIIGKWMSAFLVLLVTALVSSSSYSQCARYDKNYILVKQPDNVRNGGYDDYSAAGKDLCTRTCVPGVNMVCYYKFSVESYTTMGIACGTCPNTTSDCLKDQCVTADGWERSIVSVNRMMPGPSIQVCQNDTVVVDVVNLYPGSAITIHWHGIRQIKTPWYDGVPMVTQCPILEHQTFRYNFICDHYGTYFWHSHDGLQKVDGFVGDLIVRQPDDENLLSGSYDHDLPSHVALVQDWMHSSAQDHFPGGLVNNTGQAPNTYLINGKGVPPDGMSNLESNRYPITVFNVTQGKKYRFRWIAGTCLSCSFRVRFFSHTLQIITTDDNNIVPVGGIHAMDFAAGERADCMVHANQNIAQYWILVEGLGACANTYQVAILNYDGATSSPTQAQYDSLLSSTPAYIYNKLNSACNTRTLSTAICVSQTTNLEKNPSEISGTPYHTFFMGFGFRFLNTSIFQDGKYQRYFSPAPGGLLEAHVNNISHVFPPSPLLTQLSDVPSSKFCSRSLCNDTTQQLCECIHLIQVPHNKLLEIVLYDENGNFGISHPWHIHGHDYWVVKQGLLGTGGIEAIRDELKQPNRVVGKYLPSKDTVRVPAGGYTIVRYYSDNPGVWLMHCHFAYHLELGMGLLWQVGSTSEFIPPPAGFPTCGTYKPPPFNHKYWSD